MLLPICRAGGLSSRLPGDTMQAICACGAVQACASPGDPSWLVARRWKRADSRSRPDARCKIQHSITSIQSAYGSPSDGERGWGCGPGGAVLGHWERTRLRYVTHPCPRLFDVRTRCACGVLCGSLLRSRPRLRSRSASGAAVRKLEGRRADNSNTYQWGVVRDEIGRAHV